MTIPTRKIGAYLNTLNKTPGEHSLSHQINQLNEAKQLFLTIIPANLTQHCTPGLSADGKLIIFAENGAVAARLKQISPSLLRKAQKFGYEVTSIQIAVQANFLTHQTDKPPTKKRQLSQSGKENLSQLAASLPASSLKSAIESLLKGTTKKSNF